MKTVFLLLSTVLLSNAKVLAQVLPIFTPADVGSERTTLSFDEHPDFTPGNSLFHSFGITISRDDGLVVPIFDLARYGIETTSGSKILASISYPEIGPTQGFSTHLVVSSLQPLSRIGAYFGNDSDPSDFGFERLSIFGISNEFLGSFDFTPNQNTHIDQFAGLSSSVPFYSARFENFTPSGAASAGRAIAIDDLMFTTAVPEPSTWALLGIGSICGWLMLRHRSHSLRQK